ncbi:MAG: nucleoside diphosphate kinase regulator [Rhodobacterales bacterium]|uniref:nucleoside diphosphate kinase regulator n=1 Tax=Gemmobacter nectariphilus TaxID=220343 RepID=UPI0004104FE3|nr:nucleoside diphosphate kinase regulator [Gemmobacter nectariphilus]MDX5357885.1 nucleoside diphosphate kinase regulator [Rhodobacterales bacterium]MDX5500131.1 nucleoside diphosphate kinase regulator [Rhodobacterales bacterium]
MARKPARPKVTIARDQLETLERLAEGALSRNPDLADRLLGELSRARIVAPGALPADVAGLGDRVAFRDEATGKDQDVTLVLPENADIAAGRISVLTPIGVALIGLQAGARFDWQTRAGEARELTILGVQRGA